MSIVEHCILGKIECVRSLRTRSIRLMVRKDGSLRLTYPLLCSQREAIAFAESRSGWIATTRRRIAERRASIATISPAECEALRRAAKCELPQLVQRLAMEHGFRYSGLRISSAHTRWGSCSSKDSISLSLFVMLLPQHLREFIILHELCHTQHHNHSDAFHNLLNRCVGGKERELNRELRRFHIPQIEE